MNKVFLGLGSNKGNRLANLSKAISALNQDIKCETVNISSVYESYPYGPVHQNDYMNLVLELKTDYELLELFRVCKKIEDEIGRTKTVRWGPREIDIDILLFGSTVYNGVLVSVPHKYLCERDFVLVPLAELDPEIILPGTNKKAKEYLNSGLPKYIFKKYPNTVLNLYGEAIV